MAGGPLGGSVFPNCSFMMSAPSTGSWTSTAEAFTVVALWNEKSEIFYANIVVFKCIYEAHAYYTVC